MATLKANMKQSQLAAKCALEQLRQTVEQAGEHPASDSIRSAFSHVEAAVQALNTARRLESEKRTKQS